MSLRVPLSVRLNNSVTDIRIDDEVKSLSFRSVAPGGFASATIGMRKPLASKILHEVLPFTHVIISDKRSGDVVWQGRIEDPAPDSQGDGVWDLTAIGPSGRAQDKTVARVYIETSLEPWYPRTKFSTSATAEISSTIGSPVVADQALVLSVPGGAAVGNGNVVSFYYDRIAQCGQMLGGLSQTRLGGKADPGWNFLATVFSEDGVPAFEDLFTGNLSVGPTVSASRVVNTDWTAGQDVARYSLVRDGGATTVADELTWTAFYDIYIAARRLAKDGSFATDADHGNPYVLAHEVVADLLGSGLLPYDGSNATIATNTHQIDQMVYIDGATPFEILDDLMALENAYYWAAWEGDPPRFEWTAWPTTETYEADTKVDAFQGPSSTADLYNKVMVRWRNKRGRIKSDDYTATVSALSDAGITRQAIVDLADEVGSQANADQVGGNFLVDHAYPPNAGTLTIARPIMNLDTGVEEQPWQIRPGRLVRVSGRQPYPDPLNVDGPNGFTVMRIAAAEYTAGVGAVCELDSYSRALARALRRPGERNRRR